MKEYSNWNENVILLLNMVKSIQQFLFTIKNKKNKNKEQVWSDATLECLKSNEQWKKNNGRMNYLMSLRITVEFSEDGLELLEQ